MDLIGRRIGHVRIEKLLGSGGLGEVYFGFDEVLERPVAVKVMRGEHQLDPLARSRFFREARVLSKLDDPRICRIYDMVRGEDSDFLILEFIEGRPLIEVMNNDLSAEIRLKIAQQIAEALAVAHGEHIIHRDLKPENVMVNDQYEVKVLDFGLARTVQDSRLPPPTPVQDVADPLPEGDATDTMAHGIIVGTLRFMSPEQARGEPVTEASDLYSFGLLLQELMTRKSPYPEDIERIALYIRVTTGKTSPAEGLDPDLVGLIERLKNVNPTQRGTAGDTAAALAAILGKPGRREQQRNWVLATAGVALLLVLTAFLAVRLTASKPLLRPGQEGRIVVLPFANKTGETTLDWVNIGLMDMVAQTLDAGPQLDVIALDAALELAEKQKLQSATDLDRTQVERICRTLGTQFVITAAIFHERESYRISYNLYDVQGFKATGNLTGSSLMTMGSELSAYLSLRLTPDSQVVNIKDKYSTSDTANQNYAIGVQRLNTVGAKIAQNYFLVCLDLDPHFLWADLQLASCKERLTEWDESERITQKLLLEAQQRDRKLEAICLRYLGVLAQHRKEYTKAEEYYNRALPIIHEVNDRQGEAKIYNNLAIVAYARGDIDQAEILYQESLSRKRKIGDRQGEAYTLNNLAILAHDQGDLNKAEPLYRQSLEISREIGDRETQALSLGNLATLYLDREDYQEAERNSAEALAINRELGDREGEGIAAHNLAEALIIQGKLEEARKAMDTARAWYKDDPIMMRLQARDEYQRGNFVQAFNLMSQAKQKASDGDWTSEFEERLQSYQKAAKTGRR